MNFRPSSVLAPWRWKRAVKYMPFTASPPMLNNSGTWAPSPVRMGVLHPQVLELLGQQGVFGIVVGGIDEIGIVALQGRKSGR